MVLTAIMSLNSINELSFVMVKCAEAYYRFEVRTEFLNIIQISFRFNALK